MVTPPSSARIAGEEFWPAGHPAVSCVRDCLVEHIEVLTARSLSPNARQIRDALLWDIPVAAAIDRVDQCVSAVDGASSSVLAITCSTCSSLVSRGRPGRGSSVNPSSRSVKNRRRHLETMSRDTPSLAATSPIVPPAAHRNTIRDRIANAYAVFRRRAH
jgi:hypothetical protein